MATSMNVGRPNALISVASTTYLSDANGQFVAADSDVAQLLAEGCWLTPTLGANDVQVMPGQLVNVGGVPVVAGRDGVIRGLTAIQKLGALIASFIGGAKVAPGTNASAAGAAGTTTSTPTTPTNAVLYLGSQVTYLGAAVTYGS